MKMSSLWAAAALCLLSPVGHAAVLHENFEGLPVGSPPSGWTYATSSFSANVVPGSSPGGELPNENVFHLLRTETNGGYTFAQTTFEAQTEGVLSLTFKLQVNDRSNSDYAMMLGDATNGSRIYLRFHSNGALSIYHGDSGGQTYTGKVIAEQMWYQFQFDIDLDNETFSLGFQQLGGSDSYPAATFDFRGNGAVLDRFLIRSINQGTSSVNMAVNWYLDDLSIRPIPEPTTYALIAAGGILALGYWRRQR